MHFDFHVTRRCNSRCKYCSMTKTSPVTPEMIPTSDWLDVVEEVSSFPRSTVSILGGEPTVREDIDKIMDCLGRQETSLVNFYTNAKDVDWDWFMKMIKNDFRKFTLVVSLDTLSEPNFRHSKTRRILDTLGTINDKLLTDFSKDSRSIAIHTTVSRQNLHNYVDLINLVCKLGLDQWLNPVSPFTIVSEPSEYYEFTIEERRTMKHTVETLRLKHPEQMHQSVFFLKFLETFGTSRWREIYRPCCSGGRSQFLITTKGEVYPCLTKWIHHDDFLGSILEQSLSEIVDSALEELDCCTREPEHVCHRTAAKKQLGYYP